MESLKNAVANALSLYAETSGLTLEQVGQHFAENEECRQNVLLLVAMQANSLPYAQQAA